MGYPLPTLERATKLLDKYGSGGRYYGADPALELVFNTWPLNNVYDHVLIKVVVLNRLYSTNIYNVYGVAEHIQRLAIDDRLAAGDKSLVSDLMRVSFTPDRTFAFFSFATKYCSWHRPDLFVIYDSYVEDVLWQHQCEHQFGRFFKYQLKEYSGLVKVIREFSTHFGLESLSARQIDKYLWLEGRLATDGISESD